MGLADAGDSVLQPFPHLELALPLALGALAFQVRLALPHRVDLAELLEVLFELLQLRTGLVALREALLQIPVSGCTSHHTQGSS